MTFTFLNQTVTFAEAVDWNYVANGKLWTYNLAYFDFLNQAGVAPETGLAMIRQFISQTANLRDALEPYPTSLRIVNWVQFLSRHQCRVPEINAHLLGQLRLLAGRLEYHLMGNHLLENGFALLTGALYFRERTLYQQAVRLLVRELTTQVLADGGHDERSPMYHQILLDRLLNIGWVMKHDRWHDDKATDVFLTQQAQRMVNWLAQMSYSNGDVPLVNDATDGIAPTTHQLLKKAQAAGLEPEPVILSDSGYRVFRTSWYELIADIGPVGPDHQPGHAHADTFSFVLYAAGVPVIVDAGTSTYTSGSRRQWERSTEAHNTVQIDHTDSSEVWGGFRVGRRARVTVLEDSPTQLQARHNGYERLGAIHERRWVRLGEWTIQVVDRLIGRKNHSGVARLHFHPGVAVIVETDRIVAGPLQIHLPNVSRTQVAVSNYDYAEGFNRLRAAQRLEVTFTGALEMTITVRL